MSVLTKIRGLWRFDGDEEPVQVSRRSFLFMGGIVAAGALLPPLPAPSPVIPFALEREAALARVGAIWEAMQRQRAESLLLDGEWVLNTQQFVKMIREAAR